MTLEQYTALLENVENTHELYSLWQELRQTLKKLCANPNFQGIHDFVESRSKFLYNAKQEADNAISTEEARQARRDFDYEIWCWKRDRQEPVTINRVFDFCADDPYFQTPISYKPLDEPDYISYGLGI